MGPIPFALSISHFVNSVGADAGFAAIIGLAILVLLYFAQARETANMRERLAEAGEHVRQLEQRLAQVARGTASGQTSPPAPAPASAVQARTPVPAPAAAAAPSASRIATGTSAPGAAPAAAAAVAVAPAAPAGVGAPPLSAATRLIPADGQEAQAIRAGAASASPSVSPQPAAPGPSTAAGGANGATAVPPPASAGPGRSDRPYRIAGVRDPVPAPAAGGSGAGLAGRPGGPGPGVRTQASRRLLEPDPAPSRLRSVLLALGGLAAVAVVVVVLLIVTSSSGTSHRAVNTGAISNVPRAGHRGRGAGGALTAVKVTVAVLNGTGTTNLAHDVSTRLTGFGYKMGTIATATDQTQNTTTVGYRPGGRRAALLVAHSLNLGAASVQPVNPANEAVACPQTAACTAQVVVTVGSDLSSIASSSASSSSTG
jgi:hypothetical protein